MQNAEFAPMKEFIPTVGVGDTVHFYSDRISAPDAQRGSFNGVGNGPYLALVTQVWLNSEGVADYANLFVIPPFGAPFHEGSVAELGTAREDALRYWSWPPYESFAAGDIDTTAEEESEGVRRNLGSVRHTQAS